MMVASCMSGLGAVTICQASEKRSVLCPCGATVEHVAVDHESAATDRVGSSSLGVEQAQEVCPVTALHQGFSSLLQILVRQEPLSPGDLLG